MGYLGFYPEWKKFETGLARQSEAAPGARPGAVSLDQFEYRGGAFVK
ncbi:MAG: hypothetical protein QNJ94_19845 [Alphaproteobacteria bacterium]|nr:hypothetical protein [Alphaproteobacteria bacterium]